MLMYFSIVYLFGTLIGYTIVIISIIQYSLAMFGMDHDFSKTKLCSTYVGVPVMVFMLIPLCLMRNMSGLRYASILSIISLFYTALVLLFEMPEYYRYFEPITEKKAFYIDWNFFTGFSMVYYSFTCQNQTMPIYAELKDPSYRRMSRVISKSVVIITLFYFCIALSGYLSQFSLTNPVVILRTNIPGKGLDVPLTIACLAMCICVIVAFPLNYNPMRRNFF